jgi:hypothetical protein
MSVAPAAVAPPWPKALKVALVIAALGAGLASSAVAQAEGPPCPNEQYRAASDSQGLSDCRAYELVSPANARGPVSSDNLANLAGGNLAEFQGSKYGPDLADDGNLLPQLSSEVEIEAGGSAVFWNSTATPPGSGAIPDSGAPDPFRSVRTATGWNTEDLLPSGVQKPGNPGGLYKDLLAASEDGTTALIISQLALDPNAFANPPQADRGEWEGLSIYRVSATGAFAPQLVTRGEALLPANSNLPAAGPFEAVSATPDLSEVAFRSLVPLEAADTCNVGVTQPMAETDLGTLYLWSADSISGLPHVIFNLEDGCEAPNVASVPTILPDGRPILLPNPSTPLGVEKYTAGPLVENNASAKEAAALTPLAGPSGGTLLAATPNGADAYVSETERLVAEDTRGDQIYEVGIDDGVPQTGLPLPANTADVTCISCGTDGIALTYAGMSQDGSHVFFTTEQGIWSWNGHASVLLGGGPRTSHLVSSVNGQHVVAESAAGLQVFTAGQAATPVSGCGLPVAVSDTGERVICDDATEGGRKEIINEWAAGQITQLSPESGQGLYRVQAVSGSELENVFFIAHEAVVPWDLNADQADIYDAHTGGAFPYCTEGDPEPSPGSEGCTPSQTTTPNPAAPAVTPYTSNLTAPSQLLAPLGPDTSAPPTATPPKPLTKAQKLATALKACKKYHSKSKRETCDRSARAKYAPAKKKVTRK